MACKKMEGSFNCDQSRSVRLQCANIIAILTTIDSYILSINPNSNYSVEDGKIVVHSLKHFSFYESLPSVASPF